MAEVDVFPVLEKYERAVRMHQSEDLLISVNRKLAAEQRNNEKLHKALKASTQDNVQLQRQLAHLQQKLLSKENEVICANERAKVLQEQHTREVEDRRIAEETLRAEITGRDHKVGALEMSQAEHARTQRQLREAERELEAKEQLTRQFEQQLNQTVQNLEDVCATNTELRGRVDRLKAHKDSQAQDIINLQNEKKDLFRRLDDTEASNVRLRIVSGMYHEQKDDLEKEVDELSEDRAAKELALRRHQARVNELLVREARHIAAERITAGGVHHHHPHPPPSQQAKSVYQGVGSSSQLSSPSLHQKRHPAPPPQMTRRTPGRTPKDSSAAVAGGMPETSGRHPHNLAPLPRPPHSSAPHEEHPAREVKTRIVLPPERHRALPQLGSEPQRPPPAGRTPKSAIPALAHGVARSKYEDVIYSVQGIDKPPLSVDVEFNHSAARNVRPYEQVPGANVIKRSKQVLEEADNKLSAREKRPGHVPTTNLSNSVALDRLNEGRKSSVHAKVEPTLIASQSKRA